ncbi:MAG: PolC-type DNA polymerase III [Lachnospiraceae bacterium]|jgi:DNA polymerase-3 subunit alpha (Gram-positive type)|nr:PolC-type DNA polymerase III [Lachnospiraceae bacterium]
MAANNIFKVIPNLKLDENLASQLADAEIKKVTAIDSMSKCWIDIESPRIISQKALYEAAKQIKSFLFGKKKAELWLRAAFDLPDTLSAQELFESYKDSLEFELGRKSSQLKALFNLSEFSFPDGRTIVLSCPRGRLHMEKKEQLRDFLTNTFSKRFNRDFDVVIKADVIDKEINDIIDPGRFKYQEIIDEEVKEIMRLHEEIVNEKERLKDDKEQVIFGKFFTDKPTSISELTENDTDIVIEGIVFSVEFKEITDKQGNRAFFMNFALTDYTDSILVKKYVKEKDKLKFERKITSGVVLSAKGRINFDTFCNDIVFNPRSIKIETTPRNHKLLPKTDDLKTNISEYFARLKKEIPPHWEEPAIKELIESGKKRVELHAHTKMSEMDGLTDVTSLLDTAVTYGHEAIAITDHGGVQAFPKANSFAKGKDGFKVIYGVEGYLVDDTKPFIKNEKGQSLDSNFVVFDIETTGFNNIHDKIIEIGAVRIENGKITDKFSCLIDPGITIPSRISELTGIFNWDVTGKPGIETVLPEFLEFSKDCVMVAHNSDFDIGFIEQNARYQDIETDFTVIDTVGLSRALLPDLSNHKLDTVSKELGIKLENHHRAVDDAYATAEIFLSLGERIRNDGLVALKDINRLGRQGEAAVKKLHPYHIILLAEDDIGKLNLYTLISESHLNYFYRTPRIPKSLLTRHRKGIIVGSACESGELFQAILRGVSDEELRDIVDFYDYLEIQPLTNNSFLLDSEDYPYIRSEEDLIELNKKIVALGEKYNKPVVATCDVHFLQPHDAILRAIIMDSKDFKDADNQPLLYFRNTFEMLKEFEYLGMEKAVEVVVTNPLKIAQKIEKISPIHPDKCPPVIEGSDETLRQICYKKAHEMYGDPLPEIVTKRLEKELNSIISNGYAVMYIIAQKLVWKSLEDGYLVGSRGSVGSSFVATMAGITEVNPLSPHYYCPNCHYTEFDSETTRAYADFCGLDMPNKLCPDCGRPLKKDGFGIPFETFLGFEGNKEPDIDLNFSGEYMSQAHKQTEIIFGEGHTFRAGTISTVKDKIAYGMVKKYFESRGRRVRNCEIERLVQGCTDVKRSTGQHPGGVVVLPYNQDINKFTPVQYPANDVKKNVITTHFDYHSIDTNLLKLDLLGHDDPTMIRALEEYINSPEMPNEYDGDNNRFDAKNIPLNDPKVMSLFHSTESLGITPEDISGVRLGCLGVPEFGTKFVIQMVEDANPESIADLVRISGLSHGTNVWNDNAQTLIKNGTATLATAICTRDDIMAYLISRGMDKLKAFEIMEGVRKGCGQDPSSEKFSGFAKEMRKSQIPDWYIESCRKISYMFPKAHAVAYVTMALRIAYCKVYYPLAYYAAYFSIRADAFSYEMMCLGKETLMAYMADYRSRGDSLTDAEKDTLKDMQIVQEMYARGIEFVPIDIYRAKASRFLIVDGKLMPSFQTIAGLGKVAAEQIESAAKDGEYLSVEDFAERTKCGKVKAQEMKRLGLLGDLPDEAQLNLMDFI